MRAEDGLVRKFVPDADMREATGTALMTLPSVVLRSWGIDPTQEVVSWTDVLRGGTWFVGSPIGPGGDDAAV